MIENWTGERLETFIYNENTIEHLHRYALALELVKNKVVLDIASGEGYGSNILAQHAHKVYGVDISEETILKAQEKYTRNNLEFKTGSTSAIPLPANYCDVVVSFETIEHHNEHEQMMQEIKRVLKPDGVLLLSSPEKKYYSDATGYENKFHVKELYLHEFKELLLQYFANTTYFFQNNISGSLIIPEIMNDKPTSFYTGNYTGLSVVELNPLYNLCLASNWVLQDFNVSIFNDAIVRRNMQELQIQNVNKALNEKLDTLRNLYETSVNFRIGKFITAPFRLVKKYLYK